MHGRVLANLQLSQVEPERLHLPDELLKVGVGGPRSAGGQERVLHDLQVGGELLGVGIGEVGVAASGGGDPLRRHQQDAPVRLVRRTLGHVGGEVLGQLTLPLPERIQFR